MFRFDSIVHLRRFEESDMRRQSLREVTDPVDADAIWSRLTGLEFRLTPPPGTIVPQSWPLRMAIVTIIVV